MFSLTLSNRISLNIWLTQKHNLSNNVPNLIHSQWPTIINSLTRCSELSSGLYCRVKWLSTDVSSGTAMGNGRSDRPWVHRREPPPHRRNLLRLPFFPLSARPSIALVVCCPGIILSLWAFRQRKLLIFFGPWRITWDWKLLVSTAYRASVVKFTCTAESYITCYCFARGSQAYDRPSD
jgi:hypothetical protein